MLFFFTKEVVNYLLLLVVQAQSEEGKAVGTVKGPRKQALQCQVTELQSWDPGAHSHTPRPQATGSQYNGREGLGIYQCFSVQQQTTTEWGSLGVGLTGLIVSLSTGAEEHKMQMRWSHTPSQWKYE